MAAAPENEPLSSTDGIDVSGFADLARNAAAGRRGCYNLQPLSLITEIRR
jgi:hypothetical protein